MPTETDEMVYEISTAGFAYEAGRHLEFRLLELAAERAGANGRSCVVVDDLRSSLETVIEEVREEFGAPTPAPSPERAQPSVAVGV